MGRVFQAKGASSKALVGNVLGVLRSSKDEVAGAQRARGEGQEMRMETKSGARPQGPICQGKYTGFYSLCDRKLWKSLEQGINII